MKTIIDENGVRRRLVKSIDSKRQTYNWLFFPGGPGADSCYFNDLIKHLEMLGNYWLIDLPENGDNHSNTRQNYDYDQWQTLYIPTIESFENPIIVGHSFGAMFALLFPELENILKGFVILNSAPTLWLEEAGRFAAEHQLPSIQKEMEAFIANPSDETCKAALFATAPYYFTPNYLDKGIQLLQDLPFNYQPAVWWQNKANQINFNAKWIPQNVPTLIIGATNDAIVPARLFEQDPRFKRKNISHYIISNAAHFPWLENPTEFFKAMTEFAHFYL